MPTLLTTNLTDRAGTLADLDTAAVAADATGNYFVNDGVTMLFVTNQSGAPITVTEVVPTNITVDGQPVTSRTVSVPAGKRFILGPYPQTYYNDAQGNMNFTFSGVTSLKVLAFKATQV